ncbi:MAG: homoserine O-succinyltransferase [Acidimicrobiales bacterium]
MTITLTRSVPHGPGAAKDTVRSRVTCAFVNNMPDGAFDATERQYLGLLEAASGSDVIELRRFTLPGVPRDERTAARIREEYLPFAELYDLTPDFLIVTGSNPIETHLRDEPYWDDLVALVRWSKESVPTTLLSCLAAHAALTVFDGIERVRLPGKCTGVFAHVVDVRHPLATGIEPAILLPHSRINGTPEEAVHEAGYEIVAHSETASWAIASRGDDRHRLILVQGHPEYDPSSLLREYRRDAGRYVHHERNDLPFLPFHCAAPEDWMTLEAIHHEIINGQRDPRLLDSFPFDDAGARAPWPWRPMAQQFYTNVLAGVLSAS